MDSIKNNLDGGITFNLLQSNAAVKKAAPAPEEGAGNVLHGFGDILKGQMTHINDLQAQADQAQQTYATGGDIELHTVMLATDKADLALQLAMQVRNKILAAYQEISHMQI